MKGLLFILYAGLASVSAFSSVHRRTTSALNDRSSALFLSSRTKTGKAILIENVDSVEFDESTVDLQRSVGFSYVDFAQTYPFVSSITDS